MVNKCSVPGCTTNHAGKEKGPVFELPEDEEQRKIWLRFINEKDVENLKHIFVCWKHFSDDVMNKNEKRCRLIKSLKPVPTIVPSCQVIPNVSEAVLGTIKTPRKPQRQRIFQEDELASFRKKDSINGLEDISEEKIKSLGENFILEKKEEHSLVYQIERLPQDVPIVTHCIRVDKNLHVKICYKGVPMPLPPWFWKGRNSVLNSFSTFTNLIAHMRNKSEEHQGILAELETLKYQKQPCYSSKMVRYSLQLRYTSIQSYQLLRKEFSLPSVSYLKTFTSGEYFEYCVYQSSKFSMIFLVFKIIRMPYRL